MAQMKTLAYALHESGRCDPPECVWCDTPSVPPVHDRPQSVEAGSNLPPGGDGGSFGSYWDAFQVLDNGEVITLDASQRLGEHLNEIEDAPTNDQWRVQTLGAADWAMRKVAKLDRESTAISDAAQEEIDTIIKWRDAEFARIAPQREHWTWLLADFHEKQLAEDPKAKTIKLPHGALVARKQPDGIDIPDPDSVMAWCRKNDLDNTYTRIKTELNRAAIKKAVLELGEIIDGVAVVKGQIRYSVAPS